MLTVMNERKFHNNGVPVDVPMISLFGASNELPESDELTALYDRFLLRFIVGSVSEDSAMYKILKSPVAKPRVLITLQELKNAQIEVQGVLVPDELINGLINIRNTLKQNGLCPSDRRLIQSLDVLKARAWLRGEAKVDMNDVLFLQHVLWDEPDEYKTIRKILRLVVNPLSAEFDEEFEKFEDVYRQSMEEIKKATEPSQKSTISMETVGKLQAVAQKMAGMIKTAKANGVATSDLEATYAKVDGLYNDFVKTSLGISMTLPK
jgi:MoxR-like ATPase